MQKYAFQAFGLFIFLTYSIGAQTNDTSINFQTVHDYLIVVPVQINSGETLEFLVDTGTNTTIITPDAAARFHLQAVDRMIMTTSAGSIVTPRSFLPRLRLGPKTSENLEVLWSELPELRRLDRRIAGVLGQNFLEHYNYLVDYRRHRLEFVDSDKRQFSGRRLPIERDDGLLIVTAQYSAAKPGKLRLILDSAASDLVLFGNKSSLELFPSISFHSRLTTNAGEALAEMSVLRTLRLADLELSRVPVALLPAAARTEGSVVDGLLPMCLFRSIFFNQKEGYVILIAR